MVFGKKNIKLKKKFAMSKARSGQKKSTFALSSDSMFKPVEYADCKEVIEVEVCYISIIKTFAD